MARPKRLIHCAECGRNKLHYAKELCYKCYWRENNHQWHRANPDKAREHLRQWQKMHPDKVREASRHYCKAHPDQMREKSRRRRARKNGATIGPIDEAAIYERDKACIYCGSGEDLTLDHLIPLARGGAHAQDNLAVACRSCNSRKGTKTHEEFRKEIDDE